MPLSQQRSFQLTACTLLAVWIGITVYQSLSLTNGILIYSLDDPYIHLSVAESILRGEYGVNIGEYASPSSSILYPYILAGTSLLGLGTWGPLVLNVLPIIAACWILSGIMWSSLICKQWGNDLLFAVIAIPVMYFAVNMVALPLTGMEHSLHILASLMTIIGLKNLREGVPCPWYLPVGLLLAPLLRFEGFALFLASLSVLLFLGRWRLAVVLAFTLGAAFKVYASTMIQRGLPILPSSVTTKSGVSEAATSGSWNDVFEQILERIVESATNPMAILLTFNLILLAVALRPKDGKLPAHWPVTIAVLLAGIAHLLVGRYGWFGRYEMYMNAACLGALMYAWSPTGGAQARWIKPVGLVLFGFIAVVPAYVYSFTVPSTKNIYGQHYQMHRFLTEFFPHSVAVNDLGYTSFRNPNHVLDLYGLGSETARKLRVGKELTPEELRMLTTEAGTEFVMIYSYWLINGLPEEWCLAATMTTVPRVMASGEDVDFYLIDKSLEAEFRSAITALSQVLPDGTTIAQSDCS